MAQSVVYISPLMDWNTLKGKHSKMRLFFLKLSCEKSKALRDGHTPEEEHTQG